MGRSFDATMEYLLEIEFIQNQLDLAELLEVNPSSVSGMKRRGTINDKRIRLIANKIAQKNNVDPNVVFKDLLRLIPESSAHSNFSKNNYCSPSREKYSALIGNIHTTKIRFSDLIALNNDAAQQLGGCSNIIYMSYLKTNLMPEVHPNDVLIVKKIEKIEGDGFYIYDCSYDVKISALNYGSNDESKPNLGDKNNDENDKIIGKVIGLYREL